ncbi:alpha/beta fold hydrolase [Aggregicoccus sp. 17bor-14]|uniref:alpha/beta fold hydrolase n=1 Tax=Myxococcaceae TaxID=31 RepID=UPI00129CDE94|nr:MULTISPECIES: alpha/beta fold hydrolase [Myxococcaceae]MBF5044022.1 alpha/beta fold hydrolase [Simulacricoccus sp. 17bor-14]MRI89773.1 alpha/beta fold hydrolase [Aggregicoccus sp. 17bor-14]
MSSAFLKVPDGTTLFYRVEGPEADDPGSPFVLCDGLGCDGFAWKHLAPFLAARHRVLRWHYRGHGRSSVPPDPTRVGMDFHCDDLARVMDAGGIERGLLFGHSMGVQVALEFHRRHPERVSGLVLMCGSYGNPLDTFHDSTYLKRAFPYIRSAVERFPGPAAKVVHAVASSRLAARVALTFEVNGKVLTEDDMAPYFAHLACMDPVVFVRTLESLAAHTAEDHLPAVDVPTLVVGGEQDTFTPAWLSRRMAEAIPGAELFLLSGGTHTAPLEHPRAIEMRLERFLQEHAFAPKPRRRRRASRAR